VAGREIEGREEGRQACRKGRGGQRKTTKKEQILELALVIFYF
jgi:hypothetical protein